MAKGFCWKGMRSVCAAVLACALSSAASAGIINFDPDGAGPAPAQLVAGLDYSVGNILLKGGAGTSVTVGSVVEVYYQASLAGVINTGGITVAPPGLNGTPGAPAYEITVVSRASALITSIAGNTLTLGLNPVQTNPFYELWFDTTPDANNLAGTGFNDGTRILLGIATASVGNLTKTADAPKLFDQFGPDNYAGKTSLTSTGSELSTISGLSTNGAFFVTPVSDGSFNTSMVSPFLQVDPSGLFTGVSGGGAPAVVPLLGAVNGTSGPDFQLQADGNITFTPIPEPASFAVLAIGALAIAARRQK